jgi:hypothetical protein
MFSYNGYDEFEQFLFTSKTETSDPAAAPSPEEFENPEAPRKKRNCGRCGATSEAGRRRSALNALKHGATAKTLILKVESEEGWLIVLNRWKDRYQPLENSLEAEFVLRTAQSDWARMRCSRQYDEFIHGVSCASPDTWTPEEIKKHDLMLRYRGAAERSFHREYRALETHYKIHNLLPKPEPEPTAEPESAPPPESWPDFEIVPGTHEQVAEIIRQKRTAPPGHPCYKPPAKE